jgi:uncharacterized protein YdhG (YjbR/CyaY superfamily)
VTAHEVDDYLAGIPEPQRRILEQLRGILRELLPDAEECISYAMPAFRLDGRVIAGYAAFTKHVAFLPHSGSVLSEAVDLLGDYSYTHGSLHLPIDRAVSKPLIARLVDIRLAQLEAAGKIRRSR